MTASIHPETSLGAIQLTVADLVQAQAFYEHTIGLRPLDRSNDTVALGVDEGEPLVVLTGRPDALPRLRPTTGLFHLALLVPSRADLAAAAQRVTSAGWRFTGASDHLVSEALYLDDPEGNGIEIYRDRPRDEWSHDSRELRMGTLPLDLGGVMSELPSGPDSGMKQGSRLGHVHLQVADLASAEAFYHGILGFDVTVRSYPGALFLSAGGYHHHIGLNTWAGQRAPAPPPGARGLSSFDVVSPDRDEQDRVAARLTAAGVDVEPDGDAVVVADPSGNRVRLIAR